MDVFTHEDLRTLIGQNSQTCISAYMPTHRVGGDVQQNPIRLKNLLLDAERACVARGGRIADARELLAVAKELIHDSFFWKECGDGLALFVTKGVFRRFRVNCRFDEYVRVSDRFFVRPLLSLSGRDARFFVLAVSQNRVRLFEASRDEIREVDVRGLPKNLAEALNDDTSKDAMQFRTVGSGRAGKGPAVFFGHGGENENAKTAIQQYFRQIDRALHAYLRDREQPLVFAGVDYLFPIYCEVNTYPHLADAAIHGNPDAASAEELQTQAWTVVAPLFRKTEQQAVSRLRQMAGTGLASGDVREVVRAAHQGRVESLFFSDRSTVTGRFDRGTGQVDLAADSDAEDLCELAAVDTLLHGGSVFDVDPASMPDATQLAATFRF